MIIAYDLVVMPFSITILRVQGNKTDYNHITDSISFIFPHPYITRTHGVIFLDNLSQIKIFLIPFQIFKNLKFSAVYALLNFIMQLRSGKKTRNAVVVLKKPKGKRYITKIIK